MRPGTRVLAACCLLLLAGLLSTPSYAGAAGERLTVPTVPATVADVSSLACPTASLCVGVANPSGSPSSIIVGTGDRSAWSVTELPHPSGTDAFAARLICPSASLCVAWGTAGAATLWVSTDPASGVWKREVLGSYPNDGIVQSVTCPATPFCVATSDAFANGQSLGATAWVTSDVVGGTWSGTPLEAGYAAGPVDCLGYLCIATGQSQVGDGYPVVDSLWSTPDVRSGSWTRTDPSAGFYDVAALTAPHCVTATFCTINGWAASADGATIYEKRGYFTSTAPTTGAWDWHALGPFYDRNTGPLMCAAVGECLLYDGNDVYADPDPTNYDAIPPALGIQHVNYLNVQDMSCFDASTCQVWGSDSGQASAGPLMATKVWRGSPSGGAWSAGTLPLPAGHAGEVPEALSLACAGLECTAVGLVTDPSYPWPVTIAPVVWTAGADNVWHVVAAGTTPGTGGGGGGGGITKVVTKVARFGVGHSGGHVKVSGRLSAKQGCARKRTVKVIDKHGRTALKLVTDRRGRFASRLSPKVLARLGPKVWVKVPAKTRLPDVRCLATRSAKVPL